MTRTLVVVPNAGQRLVGMTPIGPGYAKQYTPSQLRAWAADLDRLYRTSPRQLADWRGRPPSQLTPEQRGVVAAHERHFGDGERPDRAICGSLREDGRVELSNGCHRAAYIAERGAPVPVWVASPDERGMQRFEADCTRELQREHSARAARERVAQPLGRAALRDQQERPGPERRLGAELLERRGDRDVWRGFERG